MKLPNGARSIVDVAKLCDYCLSPLHPYGKHKARLFQAALDMALKDADILRDALLASAREREAVPIRHNGFGQLYEVRFELSRQSKSAEILGVWIILDNEKDPRLVTCYPV